MNYKFKLFALLNIIQFHCDSDTTSGVLAARYQTIFRLETAYELLILKFD